MLARLKLNGSLVSSPNTFGTTLLLIAVNEYGMECLEWRPETLHMQMVEDFGVTMTQSAIDRLMAAVMIINGNDFYQSLPTFIDLCNVLSGSLLNPEVFDPADPYEMGWAITESAILHPPGAEEEFVPEIKAYIAATLNEYGISEVPRVFSAFVDQSELQNFDQSVFNDDPALLQAAYSMRTENSRDVDNAVQNALKELSQQVDSLKLENANSKNAVQETISQMSLNEKD